MKLTVISLIFAASVHAAPYIATFDPLTLQATGGFSVPTVPNSIAFGAGTLFSASPSGLLQYTPTGGVVTTFLGGIFSFAALTYAGDLYGVVSDPGGSSIGRIFDVVDGGFSTSPVASVGAVPNSIVRAGTSTYAAFPNSLTQFDAAGNNVATFSAGSIFGFRGLAYNSALYAGVSQPGSNSLAIVLELQNGGITLQNLVAVSVLPAALAIDGNNLYAVFSNGMVNRYDATSGSLLASQQFAGTSWTGVTVGRGQLFVSGDVAVPEPAAAAMVAAALGLILALRRRQRAFSRTCTCS